MVNAAGLPPCCATCGDYDRGDGVCALLADPTLENRRLLLTRPCDPQRLLGHRFRAHPPDVARDALVLWLDPSWDPDDVSLSYGRAPRDARLWLGSWPYLYLGRTAVRRALRDGERHGPLPATELPHPGEADPALGMRVAQALEKVRHVDAIGYAMLLDVLHDRFDADAWAGALRAAPASVTDRRYLAIYRYVAFFHEVLDLVGPPGAAAALSARRFAPGDPDEHAALAATRAAIGEPGLPIASFRKLYREGAEQSLALLSAPDALGSSAMTDLDRAFRRVLRIREPA
jgi:hypothetical protein